MGWKGFGEKGRGRVSGVKRFWEKEKGDGEWAGKVLEGGPAAGKVL